MAVDSDDDDRHCATVLAGYDRDRWLTGLYAPDRVRPALYALYAFNCELARTREMVREPMLGQIRLQWWRDTLDQLERGEAVQNPVARALGRRRVLSAVGRASFDRLIDAREADMGEQVPVIDDYAEATAAPVIEAALALCGVPAATAAPIARDGGAAQALCGMIRAHRYFADTGRPWLPADVWPAMRARAAARLARARAAARKLPRSALPALLPLAFTAYDLDCLERAAGDPALAAQFASPLGRRLRPLWRMALGRI